MFLTKIFYPASVADPIHFFLGNSSSQACFRSSFILPQRQLRSCHRVSGDPASEADPVHFLMH